MIKLMKNKKGASSFQGWSEAVILLLLGIFAVGIIVSSMNRVYHQNQDSSFGMGLQDEANSTYSSMSSYQQSIQSSVNTGTASFGSVFGLTLSTSYDILKSSVSIFWTVISGKWITTAVSLMNLPIILGIMFQLLYLISVGYILIKLLFRINP